MEHLEKLTLKQREFLASGELSSTGKRVEALKILRRMVKAEGDGLARAIRKDLGRCWMEAWSSEPGIVLADVEHALRHIKAWNRGKRLRRSPLMIPGSFRSTREPFGTSVIIGPWNYPAGLLLAPMVSALAAGNTVILKPSERAPSTAILIEQLIREYFPEGMVAVVNGGVNETRWLIRNAADIVCFTGSGPTGRKVMADAAAGPIPVVLELGGANPCYVERDADLKKTAERIAWGKFFAAGQTCLAPNHVFVHREVFEEFAVVFRETVTEFYGSKAEESKDYGRIIDGTAWERLQPMLKAGTPVCGGYARKSDLFVAPTALRDIPVDSPLLKDEIFGPILPLVPVNSIEDSMALCGRGSESPLAAYGFSRRKRAMAKLMRERVRSGSISVNGTLHRIVSSSTGFGGVGGSGFGRYRGRTGYRNFTWERVVLVKHPVMEIPMVYPPYRIGHKLVRLLGKFF